MDLLRDMQRNRYQINHGNKKELFNLNDDIFKLDAPTLNTFPGDVTCVVCDKEVPRNKKHYW